MASAAVDSPIRHGDDRSPLEMRPSSPRRDAGRERPRENRDRDRDRERDDHRDGDRDRDRERERDGHREPERGRDRDFARGGPRPPRRDGLAADKYRPPPREQRAERPPPPVPTEEQKQAAAKAEYEKLLTMRSGGTYIPPAKLRALQAQITDKSSKEYQRMAWEALKKSINGLINKVNVSNIKHIVPELFNENLVRGRGLFCRSIMKAQAASLPFTAIYAAMVAVVNTKLPQVGELVAKRLVMQFRKGFKRNDKAVCLSATTFLAQLINAQVIHEMLAGQILLLLLNKPTDDSVEIAVGFTKEVGAHLQEMQPAIALAVFDQFRNILHESAIDKRTQYMVEVLFQVRKDNFKDNPAIKEELDLVEEEDQITHSIDIDGDIDVQDGLNIFKFDPNYEENEEAYRRLKAEILGEVSGSEDGDGSDEDESSEEEDEEEKAMEIKDQSNTDLVNLRRTIYLTIMSSADPEEATHKLMKINLPAGQEPELPSMVIECCSQEKTYTKFFGIISERLAKINRMWNELFAESFTKYYDTIHRYETNRLRNIARLFGHLFGSDAIPWPALGVIHLTEDETTAASRIFVKILFQDMAEEMGMPKLQARLRDPLLRETLTGLFPVENPRNIRFAINYFTSIGMGALTEEMREHLANMPKPAVPALTAGAANDSDSDSDSVSSYSSYTRSSYSGRSRTRSRSARRGRSASESRSRSRSPAPRRGGGGAVRGRSVTRSRSPAGRRARASSYMSGSSRSRSRSPSYSRSPAPRKSTRRYSSASRSPSRSRSPTPRRLQPASAAAARDGRRRDDYSASRSPSRSRSRSPPPRRGAARRDSGGPPPRPAAQAPVYRGRRDRSATRDESPPQSRRRNSSSVNSAPRRPVARYRDDSRSRSPSRSPSRSRSRTASPPPRRNATRSPSYDSRRGSPGQSRGSGYKRGRSPSGSASPPPSRRGVAARRGESRDRDWDRGPDRGSSPPAGKRRRGYSESRSRSRSRSPPSPPAKRGRRE